MFGNPVLRKELLLRMRFRQGKAAQIAALLGIVFLVGIFHYYVLAWMLNDRNGFTGRGVWYIVIGLQYILICMIAPVVTANAITQEKEQQTWEMLVFTRLLPKQLIVGKLIARLMPIALIILLGMPLAVICALYSRQIGGQSAELVSLGHFFAVYFLMAATGDEVLDWHEMVAHYPGSRQHIIDGSNHGISEFSQYTDEVLAFCER